MGAHWVLGAGAGSPGAMGGRITLPQSSPRGFLRLSWAVWLLLLEKCFLFLSCQNSDGMGWASGKGEGRGNLNQSLPACHLSKLRPLLIPGPRQETLPHLHQVRGLGEGAAGLPVVKIALTIGKEKKKGQSSVPQHHAVPDPTARSFLKILMRQSSCPC